VKFATLYLDLIPHVAATLTYMNNQHACCTDGVACGSDKF